VVEQVLLASGALDGVPEGAAHANLATISVALADRLEAAFRDRGAGYVAAPVVGRPDAAAMGRLHVLLAGAPEATARVRPLLELVGQAVWPLGDRASLANVVKLACNLSIASTIETLGEAGALAKAYGVDPALLYDVMTGTIFGSPVYRTYSQIIAEGRFDPAGFALSLGLKDVRLALQAGEARHAPLPLASLLRDHFIEAIAAGDQDKDWAALAELALRKAGLAGPDRAG
jgi:3-hydroxyisobutyrate dehydrogenase-like beta-hydroxyacid dehydrogenase